MGLHMTILKVLADFHGKTANMIPRPAHIEGLRTALARARVVLLVGPRQSGKTTLARELLPVDSVNYFDLEDPASLARLDEPMTALRPLEGLVVIDEVQHRPDLFPVLRVLADRDPSPAQFLILGSASGDLLRQSAESLAGRVEQIVIGGFTLAEVGADTLLSLWRRGALPRSHLARSEADSVAWREAFVRTLLDRDLPRWGVRVEPATLRRFWMMLAHYHGQTWKASEPARALGVAENSVRRYLGILTDAFMVRQLQPWHANVRKRQVRSPKVYIRDSGLLHQLLGIGTAKELEHHPKIGASWEGFVVEQVLAAESHDDAFFWATHQGAEIDLVLRRGDRLFGVECKRADAPKMTRSIRIALEDLALEEVVVVYPGDRPYPLAENVRVVPLESLADGTPLFGR